MRIAKTAQIDCLVILSTRFYIYKVLFRRIICYHIQESAYCVKTYLKWKKHISYLVLISLFVSVFTICSICQERPAQDESDHLTANWDCGYISDIISRPGGWSRLVQIIKNKAEPWLLFSAAQRSAQLRLTQGRILWLRATHAIWAARRARHEKKCASHKLDVDIPRVLKIKPVTFLLSLRSGTIFCTTS